MDQAHFNDEYADLWTDHAARARSATALQYDVEPAVLAAAVSATMQRLTMTAARQALHVAGGIVSKQRVYSARQIAAAADQVAGQLWATHWANEGMAEHLSQGPGEPDRHGLIDLNLGPTRVRWLAVNDFRTCGGCEVLHGQEWDIADDYPLPGEGGTPCRGNCRCELQFFGIRGSGRSVSSAAA